MSLLLACDSTQSQAGSPAATEISQQELLSEAPGGTFVLDVRTPEEYAAGHVPNATNIPHDQIAARMAELESHKGSPIVVYCKSGKRAGIAAEALSKAGFTNLRHLSGDMDGWTAAGLPIEKLGS
jgi:rhodanese-related sulfurtransferase